MSESSREDLPISFSILRLSKPEFASEVPVKLSLEQDIREGESNVLEEEERTRLVGEEGFSGRVDAKNASDLCGLDGYLHLSSHFGQVHLGESIFCYVSACNNSGYTLTLVEIVVEIATHRARALLFENRDTPVPELPSEERRDFLVRYDIKDVGEHQLKCMATFTTPKNERMWVVNFMAMSPLSIRTKVRAMGESCFLEACLESLKRDEPFMLDYVHFEPVKRYAVTPIPLEQDGLREGPLKDYLNSNAMKVNILFRLDPVTSGISAEDMEVKTLGKLEIKWKTGFGETGRLQTQQIQGQKTEDISADEVIGRIVSCSPESITVYHPFQVVIRLGNYTDDTIGPLSLALHSTRAATECVIKAFSLDGEETQGSDIRMSGPERIQLRELPSGESRDVSISLVSFRSGIQTICHLKLVDETTGGIVGTVQSRDVFVVPYEKAC